MAVIEAGAEEIVRSGTVFEIISDPSDVQSVSTALMTQPSNTNLMMWNSMLRRKLNWTRKQLALRTTLGRRRRTR